MNWYLRKSDDIVYGPVDDAALEQWAAEGRIAPDDRLSNDQLMWSPAHELPHLQMDWLITMDDGSQYGPLHLSALRDLVADGSLTPETQLTHKITGVSQSLDEALAVSQEPEPPPPPSPTPIPVVAEPVSVVPTPTPTIPARAEWKEIAQSKDFFEHESIKWRKMYEDEHTSAEHRENALQERVNEMRKNELASQLTIEQLHRKIQHLEESYRALKQTVESNSSDNSTSQLVALMESYQELSLQLDALMQQLTSKSSEVQALIESRAETEKRAEEQIKHMEEVVSRERAEADSARRRVAEMEENHLTLGKAYRDLNERFIRMREQNPSLRDHLSKPAAATTEESTGSQRRIRLSRE